MKNLFKAVEELNEFGEYLKKLQSEVISPIQEMCTKQKLPFDLDTMIDWDSIPQESFISIDLGKAAKKKISTLVKELEEFAEDDIFGEYFSYFDEDDDDDDEDEDEYEEDDDDDDDDDEEEYEEDDDDDDDDDDEDEEEEEEEDDDDDDDDEDVAVEIIFDAELSFADNPLTITIGKRIYDGVYRIFVGFEYNKLSI